MSKTYYVAVPDLTAGRPKYDRARDLFAWLAEYCQWTAGQPFDKEPVYKAYGEWERAKYGITPAERSIDQSLTSLGHQVDGPNIWGISLREKDAVPQALPQYNSEVVRVAPVSADLIEANVGRLDPQPRVIDKDDTDLDAYRKMQYNAQLLNE